MKASIWADYRQEAIDTSNNEKESLTEEDSELELDVGKVIRDIKGREERKTKIAGVDREVELVGSDSEESDNTDLGSGEYICLDVK